MKKLLLLFLFCITGCTSSTLFSDNENCTSMTKFEIFQTLSFGALAHECTFDEGCSSFNQLVFLANQAGVDYYDGLVVNVPSGKCAVQNGVYRYTTKEDIFKTVPVIQFEHKNNPKNENDFLLQVENTKYNAYYSCLISLKHQMEDEKSAKKQIEFCACASNAMEEEIISKVEKAITEKATKNSEPQFEQETILKDMVQTLEKKCGKIPEELK